MTLRVVHVISSLNIGGAERHLVSLLNAMSDEYRAVICLGRKPAEQSLAQELDPTIDQYRVRMRLRNLPIGMLRLTALLKKIEADVVHTHMYESSLYGALAAKRAGVPVIVTTEHGENPWKNSFQHWLERRVISPLVDIRFCVSPQILDRRRDVEGVPESKLRLTVNGTMVPPEHRPKERGAIPVIGAVGRFIPAKDYPTLLEAVADLKNQGYKFELVLLGDGPEKNAILRRIDDLGISEIVHLPGMVTDVSQWYRKFDIYASSSVREGQPVATLEAMAHGLPIVTTDAGASSETVQCGKGGLVVPRSNSTALSKALAQLLDDDNQSREFGNYARERVRQHYSVDVVAKKHLECYRDLLSKKGREEKKPA